MLIKGLASFQSTIQFSKTEQNPVLRRFKTEKPQCSPQETSKDSLEEGAVLSSSILFVKEFVEKK